MEAFYGVVENVSNLIWGGSWDGRQLTPLPPMVVALLGTGLYFMIRLKFRPLLRLGPAFAELWSGRKGQGKGEITPWQALSTALSGQVGTGNLAGVATAITLGGPGAIFWMWITAIVGMAAAFAESSLSVRFRERHPDGHFHGGPMYYIKNGLGKRWGWLAVLFCLGTLLSATATGGMIQSNSIAEGVVEMVQPAVGSLPGFMLEDRGTGLELANWIPGLVVAALTFLVIIGGIKSIGSVAGKVVPFMAAFYVLCALAVLILHAGHIPGAFAQIFSYAFGFEQAAGGLAGYGVMAAVRYGVARGLFSNEAGQGSTPIAHAAAQTDSPVRQGEIAMLGTFIDTIVICTMTALVILVVEGAYPSVGGTVAYAWQSSQLEGIEVTTAAYAAGIPFGRWIVATALALFAFTTIIGWSYYAEQAITYLVGDWAARPFRFVWVAVVFVGALQEVGFVWRFGDIANATMALPNLVAILGLSGVVFAMTRQVGRNPAGVGEEAPGSG
jgi:AGCS family alanine or glycine:cation symporter